MEKPWESLLISWQTFPLLVFCRADPDVEILPKKKKPLLTNDDRNINERHSGSRSTVWTANEASNLLMNMTSESFLPTIPRGLILKKKKKKLPVFNDCRDSGVSSNSNQWAPSTGSQYPWWHYGDEFPSEHPPPPSPHPLTRSPPRCEAEGLMFLP